MKNFFQGKFRKLSLTQQVMVLILIMIVFLLLFFMFFLSESVNSTINKQMYDMLAARQEPIVQAVEVGKSAANDQELFNYISADANIRTAIVTPDQSITVSKFEDEKDKAFLSSLLPQIQKLLHEKIEPGAPDSSDHTSDIAVRPASSKNGLVRQSVTSFEGGRYYYRLERVDYEGRPTVIVSFMDNHYADEIRSSLMDSTVYITVLVFFLMLMILLFWVFSIIHPLNQIKSYISQVKEGKDVDLYINRDDEIGDVAKELRAMTAELAKQEKSKEEMIHNISHDLKTPIATIKSYSESIKDGIYPYGDLESSVDVILDNANRLEQKVHSLLYMNRVEYLVSSDAQGVSTNMKDVIEEVVLNAAVIRPEIELITDLEEVYFDGLLEAWRVCIENILQNAFRYAKSYIKIEVHENELKISNDGPKMDESRIQSLFLPYIKGEGGRFGLGLSIVTKIVQANKYKVEGMNTDDGVCFRIYRDVPPSKNSRFPNSTNPMSYLNVQNWGKTSRSNGNGANGKKAAPDQKQKKNKDGAKPDTSDQEAKTGSREKNRDKNKDRKKRRDHPQNSKAGSTKENGEARNAEKQAKKPSRSKRHKAKHAKPSQPQNEMQVRPAKMPELLVKLPEELQPTEFLNETKNASSVTDQASSPDTPAEKIAPEVAEEVVSVVDHEPHLLEEGILFNEESSLQSEIGSTQADLTKNSDEESVEPEMDAELVEPDAPQEQSDSPEITEAASNPVQTRHDEESETAEMPESYADPSSDQTSAPAKPVEN